MKITRHVLALSTAVFTLSFTQAVSAATIIKDKKWALEDYSTAAQPRNLCIAWTYASKGSTIYRLEFHRFKNESSLTEVQLRQSGAGENSAGWQLSIEDTTDVLSFGLRGQEADAKFFWPVPRTEALVAGLVSGKDVDIVSKGGNKEVKFELEADGFAKVWAQMQSHCSGSQQINNADFEREFLAKSQRSVDPLLLTTPIVNVLRGAHFEGHHIFLQKLAKAEEQKALRAQFQGQLTELDGLLALIHQINGQDLPALRKEQSDNETLKSNSDKELASVVQNLPGLQKQVSDALAVLNQAQEVIAPYLNDHDNLSDALSAARGSLRNAESRLTQINNSISQNQSALQNLEWELQRVERDLSDARSRLSWAQQEYNQADWEYRRFNPQQEERQRLQNNFQYQNAKNQLQSSQSALSRAQQEQNRAQNDYNRALQALRQCQATAGASCSAQQGQVSSAQNALQVANSNVQRLNSEIRQHQNTVTRIESQVRSEVRQMEIRLRDRWERARRDLDQLNTIISRSEQRSRDIRMFEIPNRRSELDRLNREASATQSEISSAQVRVRQTERDLEAFEVRVGWDTKKSALDSAQENYNSKTAALARAQGRKSALEATVANCLRERTRISAAIAERTDLLNRSNARVDVLRAELQPYEQQRAKLDMDAQAIQASLNQVIDRFDAALPK